MKILVIVHVFLPKSAGGSEYYSYYLAKELQRRGHDVTVYFTEQDPGAPHGKLRRTEYDGLPCLVAVNNHSFYTFRHIYKDEGMEETFGKVLDEVQPELVHVQHLHLHSIGYLDMLEERGVKVVYTLHEYILMCHRNGQLLKDGFMICEGPERHECAKCASFWPVPPGTEGETEPPAAWHSPPYKRFSLTRFLGKVRRKLGLPAPPAEPAPVPVPEPPPAPAPELREASPEEAYLPAVDRRFREIKAALKKVDLFISPSRFLRDKFIEYGFIDAEKIIFSDNGFSSAQVRQVPKTPSKNLRIGFIGSFTEWKGIHVLVEAFNGLPEDGVECLIYGDFNYIPDYGKRCRQLRQHRGVRFMGGFDNSKVADVLAGMDVLCVPSIWFENSPLTIHEAFLAQTPVICSDRGGMAELVEDERWGLHFRLGDPDDLRRTIQRLMEEPGLLERISSGFPEVKDIVSDADDMEKRYAALLQGDRVAC